MIVASCPLRVSLFGGSTDSPAYVKSRGYGTVISFPCNLKTYVSISQDRFGANNYLHNYVLSYSRREEVASPKEIRNEIIRMVVEEFNLPPVSIFMTSDVYSHGSGLASSSSYLIALIKAASIFNGISMSDSEICKLALRLEQKINPNCGYQDPYGCGIGGFKRMEFFGDGTIKYNYLPIEIFNRYDMYLLFTGITRNSKGVLDEVSKNLNACDPLIQITENAHKSFINQNFNSVLYGINEGWTQKKLSSPIITNNETVRQIDLDLYDDPSVLAHKLCGAGNGGFFLIFSEKDSLSISKKYLDKCVKIGVSPDGVKGEVV